MSTYKMFKDAIKAKQTMRDVGYSKENRNLEGLLRKSPKFKSAIGFDEFNTLQKFATGTQDSPQMQLLKQRAETQGVQELSDLGAAAQGQLSNVYNQLAMGGGLSSGSRERLAGGAGLQNILSAQKARAGQAERMQGLGIEQEQQRAKAFETLLGAKQGDIQARNAFEQEKYRQQTEARMALQKSQAERDVAAANACFANGSKIIMHDGSVKNIEDVKVGDITTGGIVYTIQMSMAPSKIYSYKGTYLTGGHAVFENKEWKRVKFSDKGIEVEAPEHIRFIYNLGTTDHFVQTPDGVTFGDLHETDDYEFLTDEESLAQMNKSWGVEGYEEVALR